MAVQIASEFEVKKLVAATRYSESFEAVHLPSGEKVVLTMGRGESGGSSVRWEMKVLKDLCGCAGIPKLCWEGEVDGRVAFAVEEYGQSLASCVQKGNQLSTSVLLKVVISLLKTLEEVHNRGYLHLNVRPETIRISPSGDELYLCGLHTAASSLAEHGTCSEYDPLFTSTSLLSSSRPSRKDDLESLSYVLSYIHSRSLPWTLAQSADEVLAIRARPAGLQLMVGLPEEFHSFHAYVTTLDREKTPNYHSLRRRFRETAKRLDFKPSLAELWVRKKYSRRASEPFSIPSLCPTEKTQLPMISQTTYVRIHNNLTEDTQHTICETPGASDLHHCETVKKLHHPSLPHHLRHSRATL